jgi:hypothetical protein
MSEEKEGVEGTEEARAFESGLVPVTSQQIDVAWVAEHVGDPGVTKVDRDTSMKQGMSGAGLVLLHCSDNRGVRRVSAVLKESAGGEVALSTGTVREAAFYNAFPTDILGLRIPNVYYAAGEETSGAKALLMEHLGSCIQAGYFYDPKQPSNAGTDVKAATRDSDLDTLRVTTAIFSSIAILHGRFWNSAQLRAHSYLRGAQWTKETWSKGQGTAIGLLGTEKVQTFLRGDRWTALRALMARGAELSNWEDYQKKAESRPFTLVHGDFHPGNMVVLPQDTEQSLSDEQRCCFLDWEMVGLGSGPQELGQFLISHATLAWRRTHEKALVEAYHATLNETLQRNDRTNGEEYPFGQCWEEYVFGGFGKWMWFLPLLITWSPEPMSEYFASKMDDFASDHNITPENIQMLRFF